MENALIREYVRVGADGLISPSKERIDAARDMFEAVEAALGDPEFPDAPSIVRLQPPPPEGSPMKFRVRIESARPVKLTGGADGVSFKGKGLDEPGDFEIAVPIADARDYKAGDVVIAEVRTKRSGE